MDMISYFRRYLLATAIASTVSALVLYAFQYYPLSPELSSNAGLITRSAETLCRIDGSVLDACCYIQEHCPNLDGDGLIPYASIYYCSPPGIRPYLLACFFLCLMILFSAMATAAGDFLSVHLAVIVRTLNISENLAGVTLFAFGNGSSDLFSTLAAMNSNSASLAISELFGAAAFITTVVLGLVMVVKPFSVDPTTFIGDVLCFIIASTALLAFIADGHLSLSECLGIIVLYVAFVCFAVSRAATLRPERSAADVNDAERCGGDEGVSASIPGHVDERTPMMSSETTAGDVHVSCAGVAKQHVSSHAVELVIGGEAGANSDVPAGDGEEDGLPSDNPSVASTISRTQLRRTNTEQRRWIWVLQLMFGPSITSWKGQSLGEKMLSTFSMPLLVPISLTTPATFTECFRDSDMQIRSESYEGSSTVITPCSQCKTKQWLMCIPLILGPQFVGVVFLQQSGLLSSSTLVLVPVCLGSVLASTVLIIHSASPARYLSNCSASSGDLATSALGFVTSLTWIYLTSTSAVSLLTTLGLILHIPNAVLGASIFAIGNSSNDLVANLAVARRGFPVLAASACFGGPMMNMLLGVGGGGLIQLLKNPGENPSFEISPTLFVSAATLVGGLTVTMAYAFCTSWELHRGLGLALIGIWILTTIGIVGMSMTTTQ